MAHRCQTSTGVAGVCATELWPSETYAHLQQDSRSSMAHRCSRGVCNRALAKQDQHLPSLTRQEFHGTQASDLHRCRRGMGERYLAKQDHHLPSLMQQGFWGRSSGQAITGGVAFMVGQLSMAGLNGMQGGPGVLPPVSKVRGWQGQEGWNLYAGEDKI